MSLIDSHCHIDTDAFDADRAEVLARARAAGVEQMIVVGATGDVAAAERAVRLAEAEPGLFATVGVHPHDAAAMQDDWWPPLRELAARDVVVGIGETGLDYYYDHSPREEQKRRFREHIDLAAELDKALVCHIRDAHDDAAAILAEHAAGRARTVIHCFTGGPEDARRYAELGFYVSFSGITTFKTAGPIRAALAEVPRDRLLIETDCPYLAPVPMRGKRNEPAYLVHTAAAIAAELGLEAAELAALAADNTRRVFRLDGAPAPA